MPDLKFLKLSLLSQTEHAGLQIDLSSPKTLLTAPNGFGKSAITKSLYDTLGAKPHKIDDRWKKAAVTSVLDFAIGDRRYSAMKLVDTITIFDASKNALISTNKIVTELAPFLANVLNFRLVLSDKREVSRIPPPSFMFAPFYVDQDRSWQRPWSSFSDFGMFANAPKALAEYHSGLRTNDFYQAMAERDAARLELGTANAEYAAIESAVTTVREELPDRALALTIDQFSAEIDDLLNEARTLQGRQLQFREELSAINETCLLWADHIKILEQSIRELDDAFDETVGHPIDVECPLCGHHYHNNLATQFSLKSDRNDLYASLLQARGSMQEAEAERDRQRAKISSIDEGLARVNATLAVAKEGVTLRDIVQAEGRAEAQRVLRSKLEGINGKIGAAQHKIDTAEAKMKAADSQQRKSAIRTDFASYMTTSATLLDVQISSDVAKAIGGATVGRGSVSPRALACYYYSFLRCAKSYSSSAFCPVVIDAPNQQGQDPAHLASVMSFLFSEAPEGAQIIVAAEAADVDSQVAVKDVSNVKGRLLRDDQFEQTSAYVQMFLDQLLRH